MRCFCIGVKEMQGVDPVTRVTRQGAVLQHNQISEVKCEQRVVLGVGEWLTKRKGPQCGASDAINEKGGAQKRNAHEKAALREAHAGHPPRPKPGDVVGQVVVCASSLKFFFETFVQPDQGNSGHAFELGQCE